MSPSRTIFMNVLNPSVSNQSETRFISGDDVLFMVSVDGIDGSVFSFVVAGLVLELVLGCSEAISMIVVVVEALVIVEALVLLFMMNEII